MPFYSNRYHTQFSPSLFYSSTLVRAEYPCYNTSSTVERMPASTPTSAILFEYDYMYFVRHWYNHIHSLLRNPRFYRSGKTRSMIHRYQILVAWYHRVSFTRETSTMHGQFILIWLVSAYAVSSEYGNHRKLPVAKIGPTMFKKKN